MSKEHKKFANEYLEFKYELDEAGLKKRSVGFSDEEATKTALSRVDNKTKICRFCARAEASDNIGVRTTKESMLESGHTNYKCFLEEAN